MLGLHRPFASVGGQYAARQGTVGGSGMKRDCPKCGAIMDHVDGESDVGINAGWDCPMCGHSEASDLSEYEEDWGD